MGSSLSAIIALVTAIALVRAITNLITFATKSNIKEYTPEAPNTIHSKNIVRQIDPELVKTDNATLNVMHVIASTGQQQSAQNWSTQLAMRNRRQRAIAAMKSLEQGRMTCREYLFEFNLHYRHSGYNDTAGLEEFKRGLNRGLWRKLHCTFPWPEDNADGTVNLGNWTTRAVELDQLFRRAKQLMPNGNRRTQQGQGNGRRTATSGYIGIDGNTKLRGHGLTTCFNCEKNGHFAKDCPDKGKPKVSPTRRIEISTPFIGKGRIVIAKK